MNSSLYLSRWGRRLGRSLMRVDPVPAVAETNRWNIVKGDKVQVIQGPQQGQSGIVTAVLRRQNRVIIDGVNMRRRIVKARNDGAPGRVGLRACSVHYSNVMLVDPTTGKPTKVARRFLEDGSKVRVSKTSGHIIPKPEYTRARPRNTLEGPKDTAAADVFAITFTDYEKYFRYIYPASSSNSAASTTHK